MLCSIAPPTIGQLRRYAGLLVNRWDLFMAHTSSGQWVCSKQSLTRAYLEDGLAGRHGLGFYSVDRRGLSRWVCLDLDDTPRGAQLWRVIDRLDDPRSALLEDSRRGFHLWILVEPAPWYAARRWGLYLAQSARLGGMEVFPKGAGLNGVRAPLTRHPKDGRIYPLIISETGEIAVDPWSLIASSVPTRLPEAFLHSPAPSRVNQQGETEHLALIAEVERHTNLRYFGQERAIGCCPFHDDRHPSFGVIGGFWRCFAGCGEGGLAAFRRKVRQPSAHAHPSTGATA